MSGYTIEENDFLQILEFIKVQEIQVPNYTKTLEEK